jgi:hypothetical protein
MKAEDMDREKISEALALLAEPASPGDRGLARTLLQAALDEADAIVTDPLDVLTAARLECDRQEDAAHYNSREAEAWDRAEDAIFDALNIAFCYGNRQDAKHQIDRYNEANNALRAGATA